MANLSASLSRARPTATSRSRAPRRRAAAASAAPQQAQLAAAACALAVSLGTASPALAAKAEVPDFLPYTPVEITTESSPRAERLADHLRKSGAKMYSAFWCSHCRDQKSMFGKDAPLPAFECFPDGWSKESEDGKHGMAQECIDADLKGFPTWEFEDGTRLSGDQSFGKLIKVSQFKD